FLAGVTVLFMMIFFVGVLAAGLGLAVIGIPPSGEELARITAYLLFTVVYTSLWLALAMLCSVLCRHAATSALIVITVWIFFTLFFSMIASIIANLVYPLEGIQGYYNMFSNYQLELSLNRVSPYYSYCEAASTLLNPNIRTTGITTQASLSGALASYLTFDQSLLLIWPHVTCMVAAVMAAFTVSYIAFMRQEIRA
ncbi:MAG TPA: ABC transporter permease, partial [Candidatus Avichristensenella intestinipullorum]|nr:ABC transporter permease [Candidatus Avichristensenella intestinipullorum]